MIQFFDVDCKVGIPCLWPCSFMLKSSVIVLFIELPRICLHFCCVLEFSNLDTEGYNM